MELIRYLGLGISLRFIVVSYNTGFESRDALIETTLRPSEALNLWLS